MFDIFITANCFSHLDVCSCVYHEKLLLYFEEQVTHMTKTKTTQVLDEYPPTAAGRAPPPPLPDHTGSIPARCIFTCKLTVTRKQAFCKFHRRCQKRWQFSLHSANNAVEIFPAKMHSRCLILGHVSGYGCVSGLQ